MLFHLINRVSFNNCLTLLCKLVPEKQWEDDVKCSQGGHKCCYTSSFLWEKGQLQSQLNKKWKKIMACHNDDDSLLVHPYPAGTGTQRSLNCASCSIPTAGCAGTCQWLSSKETMAVQAVGGQHCLTRQTLELMAFLPNWCQSCAESGFSVLSGSAGPASTLFPDLGKTYFFLRS